MPPIRCAPYYRVSHKDLRRGISIDIQREMVERMAASHGWMLVDPYIDDGKSAFTDNVAKRPAFQRLLADAKKRLFEVVLVYKYDRFARIMRLYFQCIHELEQCGVQVKSATEGDSWREQAISGMGAEDFSRMLSARMKDVRLWEAKQGRLVGPVPVGYERRDGQLVPASQASALRLAFELFCTGDFGAGRITRAINEAGYRMPDGSLFKVTAVQEMLINPVYAGFVTCKGQLFPGNHEAIIDLATWERAQEITRQRSWRRPQPHAPKEPLLSGLAMCPYCGAPMWHNASGSRRYYRCSACLTQRGSPTSDLVCLNIHAQAEPVEQITVALLAGLALTPELLERAEQLAQETPTRPAAPSAAEIQARLDRLGEAYADGVVSKPAYERKRDELLALMARSAATPAPQDVGAEMLMSLLKDLPTLLMAATNAERRAVVRELVTQVYVQRSVVMAIRPTKIAAALFETAASDHRDEWLKRVFWWAGWVSGRQFEHTAPNPDVRRAASESRAGKRLCITNRLSGRSRARSHTQASSFL